MLTMPMEFLISHAVLASSILIATTLILKSLRHAEKNEAAEDSYRIPPILQESSSVRSFTTCYATYPAVRVLYRPHQQADKLPDVQSLPLLVFLHGLGGSLEQFAPLLRILSNLAPCLGIDLPGCGASAFSPQDWGAYSTTALAALWKAAIEDYCQSSGHKSVVLIGHSMGCSLAALLASAASPENIRLSVQTRAIVSICPKSGPPTARETARYRMLLSIPGFLLDGLRWFDRRGGTESTSVARFVGDKAGIDLKRLQLRYNKQLKTGVWRRMAYGSLPTYDENSQPHGGLPSRPTWGGIDVPVLLIAGQADKITPLQEVSNIVSYLSDGQHGNDMSEATANPTAEVLHPILGPSGEYDTQLAQPFTAEHQSHHQNAVKTVILPAPASHVLLYDHSFYRVVAGLIEDFLSSEVSPHLELGWQLQQLTTSGKWDLKNLAKWQKVQPVSGPIDGGTFRALKTLREQDEEHSPAVFLQKWGSTIFALIDISHDTPIYDTKLLEKGGIQYHKFATVSKMPPSPAEVRDFIALVERLRSGLAQDANESTTARSVGVHCHYGYNRTGFFLSCYLIEKRGYTVQGAIDEFARERPPGIRHDHFLDTLFRRYCSGVEG